jgi:hypothetical protein
MVVEDMSNNLSVVTRLSHLSASPLSCGVRVVQSLVFWEVLCRLDNMFKCIATCDAFHRNHKQSYQCRVRCYVSGLPCLRGCVSLKQALGWSYGSDNHFGTFKAFIVKIFYLLQ